MPSWSSAQSEPQHEPWFKPPPWLKAPWRDESDPYAHLRQDELPLIEPNSADAPNHDPQNHKAGPPRPSVRRSWPRILLAIFLVIAAFAIVEYRPLDTDPASVATQTDVPVADSEAHGALPPDNTVDLPPVPTVVSPSIDNALDVPDAPPPTEDAESVEASPADDTQTDPQPPSAIGDAPAATNLPEAVESSPTDDTSVATPSLPPTPPEAPAQDTDKAYNEVLPAPAPLVEEPKLEDTANDEVLPPPEIDPVAPPPADNDHPEEAAPGNSATPPPPPEHPVEHPQDAGADSLPPPPPSEHPVEHPQDTSGAHDETPPPPPPADDDGDMRWDELPPAPGPESAKAQADKKLHLFLPATSGNEHLCRTLFSATAMGYPTPKLINWGMEPEPGRDTVSHLEKVMGISRAVASLGIEAADDLVIVTDAFDLWFNIPASTMLARYHKIIEAEDEYTARVWGRGALDAGIRATTVFAADKGCFGNKRDDHWCYMQPESSLPTDLYGPNTDKEFGGWGSYTSYRPRYLNSGVIMGPARDILAIFQRAEDFMKSLGIDVEHDFWQSDQRILSMVYVEQQLARTRRGLRNPQWKEDQTEIAENRTSPFTDPTYTPSLDIHPDIPRIKFEKITKQNGEMKLGYEHGIVIDFAASLSHTTNAADHEWAYLNYKPGLPQNIPALGDERDCHLHVRKTVPDDLANTTLPHAQLLAEKKGLAGTDLTWSDLRLYTNLCTGTVPGIVHHNGDKSQREKQWPSLWYTSAGREIMAAARARAKENPDAHVNTGGAVSDGGVDMSWGRLCGAEATRIFEDDLRNYAPGSTSFGVPPEFFRD